MKNKEYSAKKGILMLTIEFNMDGMAKELKKKLQQQKTMHGPRQRSKTETSAEQIQKELNNLLSGARTKDSKHW